MLRIDSARYSERTATEIICFWTTRRVQNPLLLRHETSQEGCKNLTLAPADHPPADVYIPFTQTADLAE